MLRDRAQNQPVGCFRYGVAQRAGQRANCVISNRMPRFRIRAYSARVALERGRGAARPSTSYRLLIPHPTASFVSRAASAIQISCLVTGLVTVNGNIE